MKRIAAAALLALPLLAANPRPASAQWVVFDPTNLSQAVTDYAIQGLQLAEAVSAVLELKNQVEQLDSTYNHLQDAANGRIAALTSAFTALTSDPARLLRGNLGQVSWRSEFTGDAAQLLDAVMGMGGSSLVDHLQGELDAADAISDADLLALYPDAGRGTALAETWRDARASGDRIRAGDFAAAEAAGRVTQLLENAQTRVASLRSQTNVSHTALQQAGLASRLIDSEMNIAAAQLLAIQAQQETLRRQEAELLARQRLERWVERETQRQADLQALLTAEGNRRAANRDFFLLPQRHGN